MTPLNSIVLQPDFSPDTFIYTATANSTVSEIMLTVESNDENADVMVNGVEALSGSETGPYLLDYGQQEEPLEITLVAEDEIATETYSISIFRLSAEDNEDPIITLIDGSSYFIEVHMPWEDPGYTAYDAVYGDLTNLVEVTGSVDTSFPNSSGSFAYSVSDPSGNITTVIRNVTVQDTTPPEITIEGGTLMRLNLHEDFILPPATVTDNYDTGLSFITSDIGEVNTSAAATYQVTYTATDSSENSTTETLYVVVSEESSDTEAPTITLLGDNPYTHEVNTAWSDPGCTVEDNIDDDSILTASVIVSGSVNVSELGSTTLNYNVSDSSGNPAEQRSRTVNVVDREPPTIEPIEIEGEIDITVAHGSTFSDPGATVFDNYDSQRIISGTGTVTMTEVGSYAIVYTAYDSEGNGPAIATRIVHVTDQTRPNLTLIGSSSVTIALGDTFFDPRDSGDLTASDNVDETLLIIRTGGPVNTAVPGVYTLYYDVTDDAGNAADTLTYTVTVEDQEAPVITLIGDAEITLNYGDAFSDPGAMVTDNYDSYPQPIYSPVIVDTYSVETFILTYDASDAAGNHAVQVTRAVEVLAPPDTIFPEITLLGSNPVTVEFPAEYSDEGATATDMRSADPTIYDVTNDIVVIDNVNYGAVGSYTIDYRVTDLAENTTTVSRIVNVVDTIAPEITISGENPLAVDYGSSFSAPPASAYDSCDGELDQAGFTVTGPADVNTLVLGGTYPVVYTISDSNGNEASETLTVEIADLSAPVISLNGVSPVTVECGEDYGVLQDAGATALDNHDTGISDSIAVTGLPINTDQPGTHTVNYDVSDIAGNDAETVSRTVNVTDTTAPVLTLLGDAVMEVVLYSDWSQQDPGVSVEDNDVRTANLEPILSGLDMNTAGVQTLTYSLSDLSLNAAEPVTRTVTVLLPSDTTAPVIALTGPAEIYVEYPGSYTDQGATATDQLTGDPTVYDITEDIVVTDNIDYDTLGSYTIDYDVTDGAGNPALTVSRTVNIVDTTGPVLSLNGVSPVTVECGEDYGVAEDAGATAWDTHDEDVTAGITVSGLPISTDQPGTHSVRYDVSDAQGNEAATAERTVNVTDTTPPVLTLLGDAEITVEVGSVWDEVDPGVSFTDNDVRTANLEPFINGYYINEVSVQTVVYSLSDLSGNPAITVQRTVNVVDTTRPVIDLQGVSAMDVEYGTVFTDAPVSAYDSHDGDLNDSIDVSGDTVNTLVLGTYTIYYDVSDSSYNEAIQQSRTVNVVDTTAPVITIEGDNPVIIECFTEYIDAGAAAEDNRDGAVPVTVTGLPIETSFPGNYSVTYEAADAIGNTSTETRTVNILDITAPVIELEGPTSITIPQGSEWVDPGYNATDDVDGDITGSVVLSGLDTGSPGTQILRYNVSDSSNNHAAEKMRLVTVVE